MSDQSFTLIKANKAQRQFVTSYLKEHAEQFKVAANPGMFYVRTDDALVVYMPSVLELDTVHSLLTYMPGEMRSKAPTEIVLYPRELLDRIKESANNGA